MSSNAPSIEEILAEAPNLRRVARGLVKRAEDAERLVREALRLAERARGRTVRRTSARQWTTTVLIRCYLASLNRSKTWSRGGTSRADPRDRRPTAGRLLRFDAAVSEEPAAPVEDEVEVT